ncbi:hypothetical protein H4219_002976 [Mycoemilia scoparia]|uniref:HEAT repeat protein n=1 Tax=Mycoemilia scoparia TaxID=417184 RepID=A0A9W8DTC9_9FUNG|nr:hypothetical protein H4219_002976 [Mycoemilia scoparia]
MTVRNAPKANGDRVLVFDIIRYKNLRTSSEQELFLFQWVSQLHEYLQHCPPEEPMPFQNSLEPLLLTMLSLIPTALENSKISLSWLSSSSRLSIPGMHSPLIPYADMPRVAKPTRALRDLVARCLSRIYGICNMNTLSETLNVLQVVIQIKKSKAVERQVRLAALTCTGALFETIGNKAGFRLLSTFNDLVALCLKIARTQSEPILVRVEATRTLDKILSGAGKAATDPVVRDISKVLKQNITHKSPLLAISSMRTFRSLFLFTMYPSLLTPTATEQLLTGPLLKAVSTRVIAVRRAAAKLCAVMITSTCNITTSVNSWSSFDFSAPEQTNDVARGINSQSPTPTPIERSGSHNDLIRSQTIGPGGRNKSRAAGRRSGSVLAADSQSASGYRLSLSEVGGRESPLGKLSSTPPRSSTPVHTTVRTSASKPSTPTPPGQVHVNTLSTQQATTTELPDTLRWLSGVFSRVSCTREERTGICDIYCALFQELGAEFIELNYHHIIRHLFLDLIVRTYLNIMQINQSARNISNTTNSQWGTFPANEATMRAIRSIVGWMLRIPLAQNCLSEQGKLKAAQILWNGWITNSSSVVKNYLNNSSGTSSVLLNLGKRVSSDTVRNSWEQVILVAMGEWKLLVEDLGQVAISLSLGTGPPGLLSKFEDEAASAAAVFMPFLTCTCESIQVLGAHCLGTWMSLNQLDINPVINGLFIQLKAVLVRSSQVGNPPCEMVCAGIGLSRGIASIITTAAPKHILHIDMSQLETLNQMAILLLEQAYRISEPELHGSANDNKSMQSPRISDVQLYNNETLDPGVSSPDPLDFGSQFGIYRKASMQNSQDRQQSKKSRDGVDSLQPETLLNYLRSSVGWIIASSMISVGPEFIDLNLKHSWTRLWHAALLTSEDVHEPLSKEDGDKRPSTVESLWAENIALLHSKIYTLIHIKLYLQAILLNGPRWSVKLENTKIFSQIVSLVKHTLSYADNILHKPLLRKTAQGPATSTGRPCPDIAASCYELPGSPSILCSHLILRRQLIECLSSIPRSHDISSLYPGVSRLLCETLSSTDNLSETYRSRYIQSNAKIDSTPDGYSSISSRATLTGFRLGPYGYEAEVGKSSLMDTIFYQYSELTSGQQDRSNMTLAKGLNTAIDFNTCHFQSIEHDPWDIQHLRTVDPKGDIAVYVAMNQPNGPFAVNHCGSFDPYTSLVDSSVRLFGRVFANMSQNGQLSTLETLLNNYQSLPTNSHRHAAIQTNILVALYSAMTEYDRQRSGSSHSALGPQVTSFISELVRTMLLVPSLKHRLLIGEIFGLLATYTSISSQYITDLLNYLTNEAIRARDRFVRAGAAVALGALYSHAGSVLASHHLKQVIVLLHSLSCDADPVVNSWALRALSEAASAAGYMFQPYAKDTFLMVTKLFLTESHSFPFQGEAMLPPLMTALPPRSIPGLPADKDVASPQISLGSVSREVATGNLAAHFHPNSTVYHAGHREKEIPQSISGSSSSPGQDGELPRYCCENDIDAHDARSQLGSVLNSVLSVFGPELQIDTATKDLASTLIRELGRSLASTGAVFIPEIRYAQTSAHTAPGSATGVSVVETQGICDQDARCFLSAQFMLSVQQQILFFPTPYTLAGEEFLQSYIDSSLRPVIRAFHISDGAEDGPVSMGMRDLQRIATTSLESLIRLYGEQICHPSKQRPYYCRWSDLLWESLILYNSISDRGIHSVGYRALEHELITLIKTISDWILTTSKDAMIVRGLDSENNISDDISELINIVTDVFTLKTQATIPVLRSKAVNQKLSEKSFLASPAMPRLFNVNTKLISLDLIADLLSTFEALRPSKTAEGGWRKHHLSSKVSELVKIAYLSTTTSPNQLYILALKGLGVLSTIMKQFCDVPDPESLGEEVSILELHQAQILSAFLPLLNSVQYSQIDLRHGIISTATTFITSNITNNSNTLSRVLRPLIIAFRTNCNTNSHEDVKSVERPRLTSQARIVLQMGILQSWAQIFDFAYRYPESPVRSLIFPLLSKLIEQWLNMLKDCMNIHFVSNISQQPLDLSVTPLANNGLSMILESTHAVFYLSQISFQARIHTLNLFKVLSLLLKPNNVHEESIRDTNLLSHLAQGRSQITEWLESFPGPTLANFDSLKTTHATTLARFLLRLFDPQQVHAIILDEGKSGAVPTANISSRKSRSTIYWDTILADTTSSDYIQSIIGIFGQVTNYLKIEELSSLSAVAEPETHMSPREAISCIWRQTVSSISNEASKISLESKGLRYHTVRLKIELVGLYRGLLNLCSKDAAFITSWLFLSTPHSDGEIELDSMAISDPFSTSLNDILTSDGAIIFSDILSLVETPIRNWSMSKQKSTDSSVSEATTQLDELLVAETIKCLVELLLLVPELDQARYIVHLICALLRSTLFSDNNLVTTTGRKSPMFMAFNAFVTTLNPVVSHSARTVEDSQPDKGEDDDFDDFGDFEEAADVTPTIMASEPDTQEQKDDRHYRYWHKMGGEWLNETFNSLLESTCSRPYSSQEVGNIIDLLLDVLLATREGWTPDLGIIQKLVKKILVTNNDGDVSTGTTKDISIIKSKVDQTKKLAANLDSITNLNNFRQELIKAVSSNTLNLVSKLYETKSLSDNIELQRILAMSIDTVYSLCKNSAQNDLECIMPDIITTIANLVYQLQSFETNNESDLDLSTGETISEHLGCYKILMNLTIRLEKQYWKVYNNTYEKVLLTEDSKRLHMESLKKKYLEFLGQANGGYKSSAYPINDIGSPESASSELFSPLTSSSSGKDKSNEPNSKPKIELKINFSQF